MKNLIGFYLKLALILSVYAFMGVGHLKAQEVEVTNNRVYLRNGPGSVQMVDHGEMLYTQTSTVPYALGITSKVNGINQQAITV